MIVLKNVTKSFHAVFAPVLNAINLSLHDGEFCIVIGANGSGKSTLLKIIGNEYLPDAGTVEVQGKVAQVVQDVNLGAVPKMTLLENMALSHLKKPRLAFYSRYKTEISDKIKTLGIGLETYIDKPLQFLSGGQRQAIATLMAITSGCNVLLLDEHTSALDPKMQALLMEYTAAHIVERGLTTVMITHKMEDAIRYGDRLIMLHQGKIVLDISGGDKKALKAANLLALFHQYQDQMLLFGDRDDG